MRFSRWIASDKNVCYKDFGHPQLTGVYYRLLIPGRSSTHLSRTRSNTLSYMHPVALLPSCFSLFILGFGVTGLAPCCSVSWLLGSHFLANHSYFLPVGRVQDSLQWDLLWFLMGSFLKLFSETEVHPWNLFWDEKAL